LACYFSERFAVRHGLSQARISDAALELLKAYDWPGNVRQLKLVVENAAMLAAPGPIDATDVAHVLGDRCSDSTRDPSSSGSFPVGTASVGGGVSLPDLERELIKDAFAKFAPNLSRTAKHLGIPRSTLRDKLRKFGIL
jgi:DNA-binding NtrC family response regulator